MKKLFDCVEILENNEECVILKVLPNSKEALICLGYFTGEETMFRLTKGDTQTCTVFYNNNTSFTWHWGVSSYTCVSDSVDKKGRLIENCIVQDFDIKIKGHIERIKNDLCIQSKSDIKNRNHIIKVLGAKGDCILKDESNYRYDKFGINNVISHFQELGFKIDGEIMEYAAENGCQIKEFAIKK